MAMMCVNACESACTVCPSYDLMSHLTDFYKTLCVIVMSLEDTPLQ